MVSAKSLKNRASWPAQELTRPGQCHHNWIEGTGARLRRSTEHNWAQAISNGAGAAWDRAGCRWLLVESFAEEPRVGPFLGRPLESLRMRTEKNGS
jgi:hypothetical protein